MSNLRDALVRTREFLSRSEDSYHAHISATLLVGELDDFISRLDRGSFVDRQRLRYLFAPTAAIQETSIDNGWGEEFTKLAKVVDKYCD